MKPPLFPSTIGTQSRFACFLTVKAVVRKFGKSDGQTGSWCLDKAVLAQGGGGYMECGGACVIPKREPARESSITAHAAWTPAYSAFHTPAIL